jgi:hypothetical protein
LKKAFPNVKPVSRPEYVFRSITEPFWVAGFTSGEGSFNLIIRAPDTKKSSSVSLRFSLNLHIREKEVIKGLINFFKGYSLNSYLLSEGQNDTSSPCLRPSCYFFLTFARASFLLLFLL